LELKDFGNLFLSEQVDLQIQVVALVRPATHPVLFDEDEGSQKHTFERHHHRHQYVRVWIERPDERYGAGIHHEPASQHDKVQDDELHGAGEPGNGISNAVRGGSVLQEILLEASDGLDVGVDLTYGFVCHREYDSTGRLTVSIGKDNRALNVPQSTNVS
jgi:hypothetical protein